MTISARLRIAALFPVACVLIVVAVLASSFHRLERGVLAGRITDEITGRAFDLGLLMQDYLGRGGERARQQWESSHARLGLILGQAESAGLKGREMRELVQAYTRAGAVFADLLRSATAAEGIPSGVDAERRDRLAAQVMIELHEVISASAALAEVQHVGLMRTQATAAITVVLCVLFMGMGAGFVALVTGQSIARPLRALHDGIAIIGQGNLEYRVSSSRADEIGELSRAFDRMTERLSAITTSRDVLNREVEERRRAERALQKNLRELAQSNEDLERFAAVASHDLQEPLRIVSSYAQLLQRRYGGRLDRDADEFIGYMVENAHRMQELIRDLLALSCIDARKEAMALVGMEAVLATATAGLRLVIEQAGAVITHDPLPFVLGDEGQLVQLLQNLLHNGIKFRSTAPPRLHVSVRVMEKGEAPWVPQGGGGAAALEAPAWREDLEPLVFGVADNGEGIDPAHKDRIFGMFQRLHARGEQPGTGIGLTICKRVVERHWGRIWVTSAPGKGSTFWFVLWGRPDLTRA